MSAAHLRRIDSTRNMRRCYRLGIEPDLFGGVLLLKEWRRIGARGRVMVESYDREALGSCPVAWCSLMGVVARKRRRGYVRLDSEGTESRLLLTGRS